MSAPSKPTEGVTGSGDETAWLIEWPGKHPLWLLPYPHIGSWGMTVSASRWTRDASLAKRFANKADAEGFIWAKRPALNHTFASEHVWNRPIPALGGDEAKRSEHKDHPTPVGGLVQRLQEMAQRYPMLMSCPPQHTKEAALLFEAASTVSALQAEVERLRDVMLTAYASMDGDCRASHRIAMNTIDQALQPKEPSGD